MRIHATVQIWAARAGLALILVSILVSGIIQYDWFSRAASVEIATSYRTLASTAMQTVSREFQRYAPLISSLRQFQSEPGLSEQVLRPRLAEYYRVYGPEGSAPDLVSTISYFVQSAPDTRLRYEPSASGGNTGVWIREDAGALEAWHSSAERDLGKGDLVIFPSSPGADRQSFTFVVSTGRSGFTIVLEHKTTAFYERYVEPALEEAFADYELSWGPAEDAEDGDSQVSGPRVKEFRSLFLESGFGDPPGFDSDRILSEYRFDPIRALFSAEGNYSQDIRIPLFRFMDFGPRFPGEDSPDTRRIGFKVMLGPSEGPGDSRDNIYRMLSIRTPEGSFTSTIERRLALNWLGGTLLLCALGLAFVFSYVQLSRNQELRRKEREFVASVSHELRTPLTVIQTATDNLRRGFVPETRKAEYLSLIADQSGRLGRMIEEVMLYSQVENRTGVRETLPSVQLGTLAAGIRTAASAVAEDRGLELLWEVGPMPETCRIDPESLRIVVENLVTNALFHAYPEGVAGQIRVLIRQGQPSRLIVVVEDDGRGIAASEARRIFEPFYRGTASRENQERGSGLGLFLVSRRVASMDGNIRLESPYRRIDGQKRSGCRFSANLPFERA